MTSPLSCLGDGAHPDAAGSGRGKARPHPSGCRCPHTREWHGGRHQGPAGEAATGGPPAGRTSVDDALAQGPKGVLQLLGPGLITGASDDDPSGIGTYSQAGSQFGFGTLWLALFTFPLMVAVQEACARIALHTGVGLGHVAAPQVPHVAGRPLHPGRLRRQHRQRRRRPGGDRRGRRPALAWTRAAGVADRARRAADRLHAAAPAVRHHLPGLQASDAGAVRLRHHRHRRPSPSPRHAEVDVHTARGVQQGLHRHRGGHPRHHHQPLPLLLAGIQRSRGDEGGRGAHRRGASRGDPQGAARRARRRLHRDAVLPARHVLHHPHIGVRHPRLGEHQHPDGATGGGRARGPWPVPSHSSSSRRA